MQITILSFKYAHTVFCCKCSISRLINKKKYENTQHVQMRNSNNIIKSNNTSLQIVQNCRRSSSPLCSCVTDSSKQWHAQPPFSLFRYCCPVPWFAKVSIVYVIVRIAGIHYVWLLSTIHSNKMFKSFVTGDSDKKFSGIFVFRVATGLLKFAQQQGTGDKRQYAHSINRRDTKLVVLSWDIVLINVKIRFSISVKFHICINDAYLGSCCFLLLLFFHFILLRNIFN